MEHADATTNNENTQIPAADAEDTGKTISLEVETSNELTGQKNQDNSSANRPTIIDRSHFTGSEIRVFLRSVQHGRLHKKSAVFVALEFWFIFDEHKFRFTSADITAKWHKRTAPAPQTDPTYSNDSKTRKPTQSLEVLSLSPSKIYGNPSRENRKWNYGVAVPITVTAGIASVGAQPSVGLESAFPRDHRLTISGFAIRGGAKWSIHENAKQASGIPNKFTCAMIVQYGSIEDSDDVYGCQASVSVVVRTNWPGVSLRGMPWNTDDPVLFIPKENYGKRLSTTDLDNLTEADWKAVVEYLTEFKDEFVSTRPSGHD